MLSAVAAFLINRCGGGKTKIIRRVTKRSGTGFQKLLNEAEWHKRTIGITLANNKWYAGYVAQNPNLSPHEEYFALLPILSGYRARDTLKVTPTIYYNLLQAKGVDTTEYIVTLPIADVKIASFFDAKQYETHFATEDPSGVNPPQDLPIEIRVSARDAVITENIFS